jgi:hypothetical protein
MMIGWRFLHSIFIADPAFHHNQPQARSRLGDLATVAEIGHLLMARLISV